MLTEKIAGRGMTEEGLEQYLDTFRYGMPPHGGLGIGLERLTMKLAGEDNVRETTLYPRDLSRLELLSLLWEEGRLDLREIRIIST